MEYQMGKPTHPRKGNAYYKGWQQKIGANSTYYISTNPRYWARITR